MRLWCAIPHVIQPLRIVTDVVLLGSMLSYTAWYRGIQMATYHIVGHHETIFKDMGRKGCNGTALVLIAPCHISTLNKYRYTCAVHGVVGVWSPLHNCGVIAENAVKASSFLYSCQPPRSCDGMCCNAVACRGERWISRPLETQNVTVTPVSIDSSRRRLWCTSNTQ